MPPPITMKSWDNDQDRLAGKDLFIEGIRNSPPEELETCKDDPDHARTKFAEWGFFYVDGEPPAAGFPPYDPAGSIRPIPRTTVFSVYETYGDRKKRDESVVLILDNGLGAEPIQNAQVWRCTYTPYLGLPPFMAHPDTE